MYSETYETQDDILDYIRDSICEKIDKNCTEDEKLYLMGKNSDFESNSNKYEMFCNKFNTMLATIEKEYIYNKAKECCNEMTKLTNNNELTQNF